MYDARVIPQASLQRMRDAAPSFAPSTAQQYWWVAYRHATQHYHNLVAAKVTSPSLPRETGGYLQMRIIGDAGTYGSRAYHAYAPRRRRRDDRGGGGCPMRPDSYGYNASIGYGYCSPVRTGMGPIGTDGVYGQYVTSHGAYALHVIHAPDGVLPHIPCDATTVWK